MQNKARNKKWYSARKLKELEIKHSTPAYEIDIKEYHAKRTA